MIVDIDIRDKEVVILGSGHEIARKAKMLLGADARVTVLAHEFPRELLSMKRRGRIRFLGGGIDNLALLSPFLVVIADANPTQSAKVLALAKRHGFLVYAVDDPDNSDIVQPALTHRGPVTVAISTGGKSPLMSSRIARYLVSKIPEKDLAMVELQHHMRTSLKRTTGNVEARIRLLHAISEDRKVLAALKAGNFAEAKARAMEIVRNAKGC